MKNRFYKLEDYSKEVLIHYINHYCFVSFDELERSKWNIETDLLIAECRRISEEKSKLKFPEQYSKWIKLADKYEKTQEKLDKLMNKYSE